MSFLLGPISGALVAGGVYYGFSTMIRTRTEQHVHDLHSLSTQLAEPTSDIHAPPPAFDRIRHRPFLLMVKNSWNTQVESMFRGAVGLSHETIDWSRRKLYGESDSTTKSP